MSGRARVLSLSCDGLRAPHRGRSQRQDSHTHQLFLRTTLGLAALGVPVVVAALHALLPDAALAARPGCLKVGLAVALPLLVLLRVLDRSAHRAGSTALLAVGAAGLFGNLALALYCPGTQASHLLVWHASLGLVAAAGYLGWRAYASR